ncbi:condensin subunit ScpA [Pilibacter termitis]|uniref:Segregation and condensation protein A n=1 Tax=Pilibacter termitis TaxID=263852 RepID=A0A1T4QNU2_9ENTE|nr:segregation/condensation protein A [Pilibacter termitis]SKA04918.1 condensin subunit ScpA [Pilibacter termitis]
MQPIQLKLDVFEGPMDLLLHLIQKLEVDIYNIPIAEVTKQYMDTIHAMATLELEVAGEYLVMASTLMAIKSTMLLPTETYEGEFDGEIELDGIDPREALVEQLLEYRKYKFAAQLLQEKKEERESFFTKPPMNVEEFKEEDTLAELQYNTIDLFLAFHQMLEKRKKRTPKETLIETDSVSIEERMDEIVTAIHQRLLSGKKSGFKFEDFFEEDASKGEIVTTFMAILELMKKKQIRIEQEHNYAPILLFGQLGTEYENE